jgi:hypothetical protein
MAPLGGEMRLSTDAMIVLLNMSEDRNENHDLEILTELDAAGLIDGRHNINHTGETLIESWRNVEAR